MFCTRNVSFRVLKTFLLGCAQEELSCSSLNFVRLSLSICCQISPQECLTELTHLCLSVPVTCKHACIATVVGSTGQHETFAHQLLPVLTWLKFQCFGVRQLAVFYALCVCLSAYLSRQLEAVVLYESAEMLCECAPTHNLKETIKQRKKSKQNGPRCSCYWKL